MKKTPLTRNKPLRAKSPGKGEKQTRPRTKCAAKSLLNKADKLCREYCYLVYPKCAACGWDCRGKQYRCSDRIEWAHVYSRRHKTIRHDPLNWVGLCNVHHRYFTENPKAWVEFIDSLGDRRWERLDALLREEVKPDYAYWIDYYTRQTAEWVRLEPLGGG